MVVMTAACLLLAAGVLLWYHAVVLASAINLLSTAALSLSCINRRARPLRFLRVRRIHLSFDLRAALWGTAAAAAARRSGLSPPPGGKVGLLLRIASLVRIRVLGLSVRGGGSGGGAASSAGRWEGSVGEVAVSLSQRNGDGSEDLHRQGAGVGGQGRPFCRHWDLRCTVARVRFSSPSKGHLAAAGPLEATLDIVDGVVPDVDHGQKVDGAVGASGASAAAGAGDASGVGGAGEAGRNDAARGRRPSGSLGYRVESALLALRGRIQVALYVGYGRNTIAPKRATSGEGGKSQSRPVAARAPARFEVGSTVMVERLVLKLLGQLGRVAQKCDSSPHVVGSLLPRSCSLNIEACEALICAAADGAEGGSDHARAAPTGGTAVAKLEVAATTLRISQTLTTATHTPQQSGVPRGLSLRARVGKAEVFVGTNDEKEEIKEGKEKEEGNGKPNGIGGAEDVNRKKNRAAEANGATFIAVGSIQRVDVATSVVLPERAGGTPGGLAVDVAVEEPRVNVVGVRHVVALIASAEAIRSAMRTTKAKGATAKPRLDQEGERKLGVKGSGKNGKEGSGVKEGESVAEMVREPAPLVRARVAVCGTRLCVGRFREIQERRKRQGTPEGRAVGGSGCAEEVVGTSSVILEAALNDVTATWCSGNATASSGLPFDERVARGAEWVRTASSASTRTSAAAVAAASWRAAASALLAARR